MIDATAPRLRKNGTKCPTWGQRRDGTEYTPTCEHDRARPRLELERPISDRMPDVIFKLLERIERIYTHPHEFPEFAFSWMSRARRSQRREALVLVGKAMLLRMDLASFRVGEPIPGTSYFKGIPISKYVEWTGLTPSRAARAVEDFTWATYQTGKVDKRGRLCAPQPREEKEDPTGLHVFRARPAVRQFRPTLFRRLRLTFEVNAAQKRASDKRAELARMNLRTKAEQARLKRAQIYATREARILERSSAAVAAAEAERIAEHKAAQRRAAIALDVFRELPDVPIEERRAEVERRLAEEQRATGPPE